MNIFVLRHGLAVEHGTPGYSDADRPLTAEGKSKLREIAAAMAELKLEFDLILSSPFKRARQTAEIVAEELKAGKRLEFTKALVPEASTQEVISHIKQLDPQPENVLVVGHEPHLSGLITLLICGERGSVVALKKGGFAKLRMTALKDGHCAELEWLLTPKQMALMGS